MRRLVADEELSLDVLDHVPETLLEVPADELWRHLRGPTLFHVAGRREPPLFVSVLLHGNEHTGWRAMQKLLLQHRGRPLARSLLLLVGNVAAAKAGVRTLPSQVDYNRVWPGTLHQDGAEVRVMQRVFDHVRAQAPFASIDIHNNTGNNPHYACVTRLAEPSLHLARLFSRTVVYFEQPVGVQTGAFSAVCPSATIECGRSADTSTDAHVVEFVAAALGLAEWPHQPVPDSDIDLMRTFAVIKVPEQASFSFDGTDAELCLRADLDHLNFSELKAGTAFGRLGGAKLQRLLVQPGGDFASSEDYFDYVHGEIRLSRAAIPAMLTLDAQAVRLDSLGYLMHRIDRRGARKV